MSTWTFSPTKAPVTSCLVTFWFYYPNTMHGMEVYYTATNNKTCINSFEDIRTSWTLILLSRLFKWAIILKKSKHLKTKLTIIVGFSNTRINHKAQKPIFNIQLTFAMLVNSLGNHTYNLDWPYLYILIYNR